MNGTNNRHINNKVIWVFPLVTNEFKKNITFSRKRAIREMVIPKKKSCEWCSRIEKGKDTVTEIIMREIQNFQVS